MADKQPKYAFGTQLVLPNGETRLYVEFGAEVKPQDFVVFNVNHRAVKWPGGMLLPNGLAMSEAKKDEWGWILVQNGRPAPPSQPKIQLTPDQMKNIEKSKS